jgi:hypothetical protein
MKSELINLLHRLQEPNLMENFQSLVVFPNGRAMAFFRHGCRPFATLDELEDFAYARPATPNPQPATDVPQTTPPPQQPSTRNAPGQ